LAASKPAQLLAHRIERLGEMAIADGGLAALAHQSGEPRAAVGLAGHHALERSNHAGSNCLRRQPNVGGPHDLALTHRNTAEDLGEVFAEPDLGDQELSLAEPAG